MRSAYLALSFFLLAQFCFAAPVKSTPKPSATKADVPTEWSIDSDHSAVNFKIKHLGISTVSGSFSGVKGKVLVDEKNPTNASVTASVDIGTIHTGIEKRDKHLLSDDFFAVTKFPTANFVSTKILKVKDGDWRVFGNLTLHGVTKEVELVVTGPTSPVKNLSGGLSAGVNASTKINRKDFGLAWSNFVEGVSLVADEVAIELEVELTKPAAKN